MYDNVTGIILSGGKSIRMGTNKSLLKFGEATVIEHTNNLMNEIFHRVILITNTPDQYKKLGIEMFRDEYKNMGPLAGIHSGLKNSKDDKNFIISCDLPLITKEMIEYIVDFKSDSPIILPKAEGYVQQLAGIYKKDCLPVAEEILKKESENKKEGKKNPDVSVSRLIDKCGVKLILAETLPFYQENTFFNMNDREDYMKIMDKI